VSCSQVQQTLREVSGGLPTEIEAHLQGCEACNTVRQNYVALCGVLPELPAPPLPSGFELDLRRRLKEVQPEVQPEVHAANDDAPTQNEQNDPLKIPRRRSLPLALAAAAALILVLGAWLLLRSGQPTTSHNPTPPQVSYHQLRLDVATPHGEDPARFEIRLPADVQLAPRAGDALLHTQRVLRWKSQLRPGRSSVDLPLVARVDREVVVQVRLATGARTYKASAILRPSASITIRWLRPQRRAGLLQLLLPGKTAHAAGSPGVKLAASAQRISASTLEQVAQRLRAAVTARSGQPAELTMRNVAAPQAAHSTAAGATPPATTPPAKAEPKPSPAHAAPRAAKQTRLQGKRTAKPAAPAAKPSPAKPGAGITNQLLRDADKLARPKRALPASGSASGAGARSSTPAATGTERLHAPPRGATSGERHTTPAAPGTGQAGTPGSAVGAPGAHSSGAKRPSGGSRK
jgi:hypothetical protein